MNSLMSISIPNVFGWACHHRVAQTKKKSQKEKTRPPIIIYFFIRFLFQIAQKVDSNY